MGVLNGTIGSAEITLLSFAVIGLASYFLDNRHTVSYPSYVILPTMPETIRKRGRPRKYDTPAGKAKQDVNTKRAPRRLQKPSAHGDIRFQICAPQQIEAFLSAPSPGRLDLTNRSDDITNAGSWASQIQTPVSSTDTTAARNGFRSQSTEGTILASPCPQRLHNAALNTSPALLDVMEDVALPLSCKLVHSYDSAYAAVDDDIYKASDSEPSAPET